MATIKEYYQQAIEKAMQAAENITEDKYKAMAYANIAQALAQTGLIKNDEPTKKNQYESKIDSEKEQSENTPKTKSPQIITREDLKRKPKTVANQDTKQDDSADEKETSTDNFPDKEWEAESSEWTKEAQENLKDELAFVTKKVEEYGEDSINECVVGFSSGAIKDWTNLNPMNIKGFVFYLKELEKDAEEKEPGEYPF